MFSAMLAPLNSMRVGAVLALDGVAAVAGVPDEGVVAGAQQGHVVAVVAVMKSLPSPPSSMSSPVAAEDGVVAGRRRRPSA